MNTIKTMFVTATLLAVGYGTHIVLNRPAGSSPLSEERIWEHQGIELPGVPNAIANVELPQLQPAVSETIGGNANPFAQPLAPPRAAANPFASNGNPVAPFAPTATPVPQPTTNLVDVPGNHSLSASAGSFQGRPDLGIQSFDKPLPTQSHPPALEIPAIAATGTSLTPSPPINNTAPPQPAATVGPLTPPVSQLAVSTENNASSELFSGATTNYQQPVSSPSVTPLAAPHAAKLSAATFASTWQAAQTQIGRGELAAALATLSGIYNHSMNNVQREQLVALLDQLAGPVIYSQQHLMNPAYTPRVGETTAQVATRQRVPADFLARVNGINPQHPLTPDMKLKVVNGPFRAEISKSRRELTVFLGGHYAGRFAVSIGSDFPMQATSFEVFEKSGARAYTDPRTGQQMPAGHPMSPFGSHWIGLRSSDSSNILNCGMHSVGAGFDAADSRGCIGLSGADADDLKAILELGSPITVVP